MNSLFRITNKGKKTLRIYRKTKSGIFSQGMYLLDIIKGGGYYKDTSTSIRMVGLDDTLKELEKDRLIHLIRFN